MICVDTYVDDSRSGLGGLLGLLLGEAVLEGLVGDVGVGERHAFEMVGRVSDIMLTPGSGTSPTAG